MNDVFRAKGSDKFGAALHGEEGKINYRDFGRWVDMADEALSAEEFEESVLQQQVEHLKKYVIKRTAIKGKGADFTDEEKTTIATRSLERQEYDNARDRRKSEA